MHMGGPPLEHTRMGWPGRRAHARARLPPSSRQRGAREEASERGGPGQEGAPIRRSRPHIVQRTAGSRRGCFYGAGVGATEVELLPSTSAAASAVVSGIWSRPAAGSITCRQAGRRMDGRAVDEGSDAAATGQRPLPRHVAHAPQHQCTPSAAATRRHAAHAREHRCARRAARCGASGTGRHPLSPVGFNNF